MKLYNMRDNSEICSFNESQLDFLKKNLLKDGESDEDFYINLSNYQLLKDNAETEDENRLVEEIKRVIDDGMGKGGLDIYYE